MKRLVFALLVAASASSAQGAGGGDPPYTFKPDTTNKASLQRGARTYMNYCAGCHSLKYLRYNRIGRDLEIPPDLLQKHLMFTSEKSGDVIKTAMPADAATWFGRVPPDLTLTARERGANWIYSYLLTFYLDKTKAVGVNNVVLPGASMPHVLGELQGWQVLVEDKTRSAEHNGDHRVPTFELVQPGTLSPSEYKAFVGDLVNFMVYAAEPGRNERISLGISVLLFLLVFTVLAYFLKAEYWKDVH